MQQRVLLSRLVQALRAGMVGWRDEVVDAVLRSRQLAAAEQQRQCKKRGSGTREHESASGLFCYSVTLAISRMESGVTRRRPVLSPFLQPDHAHRNCLARAVRRAEAVCRERGLRLTKLRRRVLELVCSGHEPVKAYELLGRLKKERRGAAPPTVYRALDFLRSQGFVHKIQSLNAFVACGEPGHGGSGQFLICRDCGEVAEMDDPQIVDLLAVQAHRAGFASENQTIELRGLCSGCRTG